MNANTKNFNIETTNDGVSCLKIPAGTKRIVLAVPGDATLAAVTHINGMGLDVKSNFTKKTVAVKGANGYETTKNYSVFVAENENGLAYAEYGITIE